MREFDTGATRDSDEDKLDFEGFICPFALERYAEYMHKHRIQADGNLRDSDNWQKGIPMEAYMKSRFRHYHETWKLWRSRNNTAATAYVDQQLEESLCAEIFNAFGMLHELVKARRHVANTFQFIGTGPSSGVIRSGMAPCFIPTETENKSDGKATD